MIRKSRNVPNSSSDNYYHFRKNKKNRSFGFSGMYLSFRHRLIPMMCFTSVMIVIVYAFTIIISKNFGMVNGDYLYWNNTDNIDNNAALAVVLEYVKPEQKCDESVEDYDNRRDHPFFLANDYEHPRAVIFYASWCGHCQHYAPKFIQIAKDVKKEQSDIDFYAISCPVYSNICANNNVNGYPTVLWFDSYVNVGEELDRDFQAKQILKKFQQQHPESSSSKQQYDDDPNNNNDIQHNSKTAINKNDLHMTNNVLEKSSSTTLAITTTVSFTDRYHDASISFMYALQNGIFMTNEALNVDQTRTLHDWLHILEVYFPTLHNNNNNQIILGSGSTNNNNPIQISAISTVLLQNFDTIVLSQSNLSKILTSYTGGGALTSNPQWSHGCNHGDPHKIAYTCGLWELFHIMTVGVAKKLREDKHMISAALFTPLQLADTLRDYIEHFFACDVCRLNFLSMYDSCKFQRCDRLLDDLDQLNSSPSSWRELALWLWEVHNEVNVRLYHEKLEEEGNQMEYAMEDDQKMKWPSVNACPKCWNEDSSWNEDDVYHYLERQYWPGAEEHPIVDTHRREWESKTQRSNFSGAKQQQPLSIVWRSSLLSVIGLGSIVFVIRKRRTKKLWGRHKKPC